MVAVGASAGSIHPVTGALHGGCIVLLLPDQRFGLCHHLPSISRLYIDFGIDFTGSFLVFDCVAWPHDNALGYTYLHFHPRRFIRMFILAGPLSTPPTSPIVASPHTFSV